MEDKTRILIVDDDILAANLVEARILHRFPNTVIDATVNPKDLGDYDIYLIDNEFNGVELALSLARTLRFDHPEALIIGFSGTLNGTLLKDLLNAGCNGACDKSSTEDFETMLDLIEQYHERRAASGGKGILGVVKSMASLLREWNQRLDRLEVK